MATQNVFAIFGAPDPNTLDARVSSAFAGRCTKIGPGQWLVSAATPLAAEVYKAISNQETDNILCIVTPMNGHYGWQNKAVWDWIEAAKRAI